MIRITIIETLSVPYWMSIFKSKDQARYCNKIMPTQQYMYTSPKRFLKIRAKAMSILLTLRELLKWIISFSLLFLSWCPFIFSSFSQSLLLFMQMIFFIGQKLRKRYSPKFSFTIYNKEREEFGSISDSPITIYYYGSGQTSTSDYDTFLLAGEESRPSLPPKSKLCQLSVLLTETTSSFYNFLRLGGEGDGQSRSLRNMLGMSIRELSSESSKDILCIWQLFLVGLFLVPYALLTSFQQGVDIYQIIFNGKDSEVLHYRCYNSTNQMENSISSFLKSIDKSQTKSIAQIQKQLLTSNSKLTTNNQNLIKTHNVSDIKVVSPFYARPGKCNNQNCLCPYHRKLRIKQIPLRKIENRPLQTKTANNSPNTKVRTQTKEDLSRETHRLTAQPRLPQKMNTILNWQGRKKVDSRNEQFDDFLRQFQQILLKKTKLKSIDLHKIKSSVGEIFKYIYTHLDQENQVVQEHISKIEKDRDFTQFYMQRFLELKHRNHKRKEQKKMRTEKHKTMMSIANTEAKARSRKDTKSSTKLYQRTDLAKKTIKSKYQKLIAQQFLQDIDCGEEVEDQQIQMFADLEMQRFEENCQFLQKKIKYMDQDTLDQLLTQIIHKAKKKIISKEPNDFRAAKIERLDKLVGLINSKIQEIRQNENEQQLAYRPGASSHSIKTNGNSIHSINKHKKVTILGKTNQSIFAKSGFNQIKRQDNNSESSKEDVLDEIDQKGDNICGRRNSPKAMTLFMEGQQSNLQVRTGKSDKLKLAKYRRLSHDAFYHKKILGEQQEDTIFQKMKIMTLEDISTQLDNLAFQFAQKKHKLRDIEGKIKDFSLNKYIINENDSLITAKRKIRVLKSLLKDDEFDHHLKGEMKQYLALIEEQNYLKNRKWANKKIRNALQLGLQNEQVQLCDIDTEQSDKYYFERIVNDIFSKNSKLIFYEIFKTIFEQKETNFEQHVMEYMNKTIIQQKKQRQVNSAKKKTFANKNKTMLIQDRNQGPLMQVGLNNKCFSKANYLMNQEYQSQQFYKTGQLLQDEQPIQLSEDRYLSLFNKLSMLSK